MLRLLIYKKTILYWLFSWRCKSCKEFSYSYYLLVIFFSTYSVMSLAEPSKSIIPILMDNAWVYVIAELWYEKRQPPITFQVNQTNNLTDPVEQTLARYYERAKANQINSVINLFSEEDGSRLKFQQAIQSKPALLSSYADLETVTLSNKALWGLYQLLNVKLTGGSGTTEWREDLLCQGNNCGISNIMDNSNSGERILETTLAITMGFFEGGVNLSEYQNTLQSVINKNMVLRGFMWN